VRSTHATLSHSHRMKEKEKSCRIFRKFLTGIERTRKRRQCVWKSIRGRGVCAYLGVHSSKFQKCPDTMGQVWYKLGQGVRLLYETAAFLDGSDRGRMGLLHSSRCGAVVGEFGYPRRAPGLVCGECRAP